MKEEAVINPALSWRPDRKVTVTSFPEADRVTLSMKLLNPDGSTLAEDVVILTSAEFEAVKKVTFARLSGFA